MLPRQGIEVRFADDDRPECIEPLIDESTKAVFCESVGNPALNVVDLEAVSDLAHRHGVPLIVDNTIATPMYLKPIEHGADVVVHSLTKFIGGHGTTLGGAIIDAGRFPWADHPDRFPTFNRPEPAFHGVVYAEQFPEAPYAVRCRTVNLRNSGSTLSPLGAFLLLQGLETLAVRLERHESNTRAIAQYLAAGPTRRMAELARGPGVPLLRPRPALPEGPLPLDHHLRRRRRLRRRDPVLRLGQALQTPREHGRRQVARRSPRLDDTPPAVS